MRAPNKFTPAQAAITRLLGRANVFTDPVTLALNSFDGSPGRSLPEAVLNITDAAKLPKVIKILAKHRVPFVPRASATNHDGGALALKGGAVLNLAPLDKILAINTAEGYAEVEPGVVNQDLQNALEPLGYFYAADPASMALSTIGGNTALNAGGAKTLKYGSAIANLLGATVVLPSGEVLELSKNAPGPGLLALLARSEGTLGVISKLRVKIIPKPKGLKTFCAAFASLQDTMNAVAQIIAAGILPCALEAMDKTTLLATQTPHPPGAEALLIIELDSPPKEEAREEKTILNILAAYNAQNVQSAKTASERDALWARRKNAASSLVRLAPNMVSLDCAFARADLPKAIVEIRAIFERCNVRAAVVFHAGDGNAHPNIVYDETNLHEAARVQKAVKEIHALCAQMGASISGEHGIGVQKRSAMAQMFSEGALNLMRAIKAAVDPQNIANPDKILPLATAPAARKTPPPPVKEIEIDLDNYTLTAPAGAKLKTLAAALAKQKMFLSVPAAPGALGDIFTQKTFTDFADYVTGLDFTLKTGERVVVGGKNVKNAAGHDLIRLLHGSGGHYAQINALTMRVFAAPPPKQKPNNFAPAPLAGLALKLKEVFAQGGGGEE